MSVEKQSIDLFAGFLDRNGVSSSIASFFTTFSDALQNWFPDLNEDLLRRLLSHAMRSEEEHHRPIWSFIIDSIREETTRRQQLAPNTMRELLEACHMDRLETTIQALRAQSRIDYIVVSQFKLMKEQAEIHKDETLSTIVDHILVHIAPSPSSPSSSLNQDHQEEIPMEALVDAGEYLQSLLKLSNGDANQLSLQLQQDYDTRDRFHAAALLRVLDDNIDACRSAGYTNKLKLFIFVKVRYL